MKVEIKFSSDRAYRADVLQVTNIAKELIETCGKVGVHKLTLLHDYFAISIEQDIISVPDLSTEEMLLNIKQ